MCAPNAVHFAGTARRPLLWCARADIPKATIVPDVRASVATYATP